MFDSTAQCFIQRLLTSHFSFLKPVEELSIFDLLFRSSYHLHQLLTMDMVYQVVSTWSMFCNHLQVGEFMRGITPPCKIQVGYDLERLVSGGDGASRWRQLKQELVPSEIGCYRRATHIMFRLGA
jgi:hypothetical protein